MKPSTLRILLAINGTLNCLALLGGLFSLVHYPEYWFPVLMCFAFVTLQVAICFGLYSLAHIVEISIGDGMPIVGEPPQDSVTLDSSDTLGPDASSPKAAPSTSQKFRPLR